MGNMAEISKKKPEEILFKAVPIKVERKAEITPQREALLNLQEKATDLTNRVKDLFAPKRGEKPIEIEVIGAPKGITLAIAEYPKIELTYAELEKAGLSREVFAKISGDELNRIALSIPKNEPNLKELFLAKLSKWAPAEKERAEVITLSPATIGNIRNTQKAYDDVIVSLGGTKTKDRPVATAVRRDELQTKQNELSSIEKDTKDFGFSIKFNPVVPDTVKDMADASIRKSAGYLGQVRDDFTVAMAEGEKKKRA
jgi:hypothetical protein